VERAAELENEADRGGIRLVAAALERGVAEVGHGSSGWKRRNLTPIGAKENRAPA
jgi:hypothetical protein